MQKSDFYYNLPPGLIAQEPASPRDSSRLLCMDRATGALTHRRFFELPELLCPGDLLVLNDSKVLPARLLGRRSTGSAVEFLLLEDRGQNQWEIMVRPGRKAAIGARFSFGDGALLAEITDVLEGGNRLACFEFEGSFFEILDKIGQLPLPHYITQGLKDKSSYQTVYARERGSAAAPTAGLHFTDGLLEALRAKGIDTAFVTLHVGLGTFRPVKTDDITQHHMHREHYSITKQASEQIRRTRKAGGRVICVGTTSCRTLESAADEAGFVPEQSAYTDIFMYPGYRFKAVDALVTNFHLPESTLIMLVSAFAGYENTMRAYSEAVSLGYRFFSLGDAMFIS